MDNHEVPLFWTVNGYFVTRTRNDLGAIMGIFILPSKDDIKLQQLAVTAAQMIEFE
jgi:hypothetical protein